MKLKTFIGIIFCCFAFSAFSQESKWEVVPLTDDFGEKTGNCYIASNFYDEEGIHKTQISFARINELGMTIGINYDFDPEIKDQEANLSIKTESGMLVINAQTGSFFNKGNNSMAVFKANDTIIWAFKNSSKLKLAIKLSGYKSLVIEVDCIGFTKAYNEMLNCM